MIIIEGIIKRTNSQRISNSLFFAAVFSFLVSSCDDNIAYNKSADVRQEGWTPADSLLFEFNVMDSIPRGRYNVLLKDWDYNLSLSFRYSEQYEYTTMPIHIRIDSKSYFIQPELKRGTTWGSLMQDEFAIKNIAITFADTGRHVIAIYPDTTLVGINSAGIDISK